MEIEKKLAFLLLLLLLAGAAPSGAASDAVAMGDLARAISGAPSSWRAGTDPCGSKWEGVTCDSSGRVVSINLGSSGLSGNLAASISKLSSLRSIYLPSNALSGPLPSLASLASLESIALDGNSFSSIPNDFFDGLSALRSVSLDDNPLSPWMLPSSLGDLASLSDLSLSNCSVFGTIPSFMGSMPSLQSLRLSYNNLSGELPSSFAGSVVTSLQLNNQLAAGPRLSGTLAVVGAMPQLALLWVQSNGFTGPIPDVANLSSLQSFNARDNALTGPVPASLLSCPTLKNVSLSNNHLQGPFPAFSAAGAGNVDVNKGNQFCLSTPGPCDPRVTALISVAGGFGYPALLASSWKGNDPCAGGWMGVVCDAQGNNVTVLNLANQHFAGFISDDLGLLTSLTKIILSNNNLSGTIPNSIAALPLLQLFDVKNNALSGKVPSFAKSVDVKLEGNPSIGKDISTGGPPGSPSTAGGASGPMADGAQSGSGSVSPGLIAGIIITILVVLLVGVASWFYCIRRRKKAQKFGRVPTQIPSHEPEIVKIGMMGINGHGGAISELYSQSSNESAKTHVLEAQQSLHISMQALREATNNFAQVNILGRGGFGVVYKGDLNGTIVAVKRNESDLMGKKGMSEFHAEIDVLRKVRHRHLVSLLGYCIDGYERLLVYEYMPEGTLGQHLFDKGESGYCPLNWKQRLAVALDVARGIEYLHSLAQESFIHRDLKPSNILLDKDLRGKVSDFGLVKLADNEKSMMTRLAGTFGYLAPEYAITGKVTTKVDVYAFGVILMEIITGRKALDDTFPEEETHLVTCFRRNILHKDKFINSIDPILDLNEEARGSLLEVAELARHCTAREPNQRPDMSHAVNILAPLVEQWKPSTCEDEDNYAETSMSLTQRLEHWQSDGYSTTEFFGPKI